MPFRSNCQDCKRRSAEMTEWQPPASASFRARAAKARRLARTLDQDPAAKRLEELAEELEQEANRAETQITTDPSPVTGTTAAR